MVKDARDAQEVAGAVKFAWTRISPTFWLGASPTGLYEGRVEIEPFAAGRKKQWAAWITKRLRHDARSDHVYISIDRNSEGRYFMTAENGMKWCDAWLMKRAR